MKNIFALFIASFILMLNAFSAENVVSTNPPAASVVSTNATVQSTLNDVVIDILRGAKSAGSEVYAASKSAITQAVDFTMEQAPLVVKEFLHWRLAESIINLLTAVAVPIVLLFVARAFRKRSEDPKVPVEDKTMLFDQVGCRVFKWIVRIVAIVWLVFGIQTHLMTIAKIAIAPRVYLIEYVVDNINTARGVTPTNNNR